MMGKCSHIVPASDAPSSSLAFSVSKSTNHHAAVHHEGLRLLYVYKIMFVARSSSRPQIIRSTRTGCPSRVPHFVLVFSFLSTVIDELVTMLLILYHLDIVLLL